MEQRSGATILILEDDESDLFFLRRALAKHEFKGHLHVAQSVCQARDYLEGRDVYADREYYPLPDLIISDFKMKGPTGLEFLRWMRARNNYSEIPVVMFSGTALPQDQAAVLASGARAFFTKSGDFREVCQSVGEILKHLPARRY